MMNLLEFYDRFPDEEACEKHLISSRWPNGFICPHCSCKKAWYLNARRSFECSSCHRQQGITAGTVFHRTRVPLREWFLAIHLLASSTRSSIHSRKFSRITAIDKKGISALALQRQLPRHDENTIRLLLNKLKTAMGKRDELYQLTGVVEVDEAFFGGRHPGGKTGRGSENKQKVLVSVSVNSNDRPTFVKFQVLENLTKSCIESHLKESVNVGAQIVTDGYRGYNGLNDLGFKHLPFTMELPQDNQAYLPWVHILISNAKRFINGTHHSVKYLQTYLNEFAWRFNRRFSELFDSLLNTGIHWNPA